MVGVVSGLVLVVGLEEPVYRTGYYAGLTDPPTTNLSSSENNSVAIGILSNNISENKSGII